MVLLHAILFVLAVLGNISVTLSIFRGCGLCCYGNTGGGADGLDGGGVGKSPHAHRHALLLSLAIADLLTAVVCLPIAAVSFVLPLKYKLPIPMCVTAGLLQGCAHLVSNFALALVALDRYLALKKPKLAGMIASRSTLITTSLWLGALVLSVPRTFISNPSLPICWESDEEDLAPEELDHLGFNHSYYNYSDESFNFSSNSMNYTEALLHNIIETIHLQNFSLQTNQSHNTSDDMNYGTPLVKDNSALWRGLYYTTVVILGHSIPCGAVVAFHVAVSKALRRAPKDTIKLNKKPKQVNLHL